MVKHNHLLLEGWWRLSCRQLTTVILSGWRAENRTPRLGEQDQNPRYAVRGIIATEYILWAWFATQWVSEQ